MDEIDDVWSSIIEKTRAQAEADGRADVAKYLALKAGNDAIRRSACQWLFESFLNISTEVNRRGIRLEIENESPHQFPVENATMVGSLLRIRQGLRCLTIETGWTRTPKDGFMKGGSLAAARISHFGLKNKNADFKLVKNKMDTTNWVSVSSSHLPEVILLEHLHAHFAIFLDFESFVR